jgi:hypothetical protein
MQTLYELAAQYRTDLETLSNLDLSDEAIQDTLEGMSGDLETKAHNLAAFVRNLETTAKAIKEAEVTMAKRRKVIEARIDRLKTYTLNAMIDHKIDKITSPYFVLSIAKNPPSVDIYDPEQIPALFIRQPKPAPPEIDKKAILEMLKDGWKIRGCRLNQGLRLQIK